MSTPNNSRDLRVRLDFYEKRKVPEGTPYIPTTLVDGPFDGDVHQSPVEGSDDLDAMGYIDGRGGVVIYVYNKDKTYAKFHPLSMEGQWAKIE